jgi:hypothetical protein
MESHILSQKSLTGNWRPLRRNKVIIPQLLPRLLTDGVVDIPCVDEVAAKKLYKEMPTEYVSLVIKRQKRLAAAFHEHMTKGQTYHTTNSNRRTFYTDVTNMVKQVNLLSSLFL